MPPEFNPFEEGGSTWLNPNDPPRVRQADDDNFLMDHEPTPEPEAQPDLMQPVEHSFSSVSSTDESKSQSPSGAAPLVPSLSVPSSTVGNSTIKEEESLDDLYGAASPIRRNPKGALNGQRQAGAATPSGLKSPTPSNIANGNSTNGITNNQPPRSTTEDSLAAQQATLTIDGDDDDDFMVITVDRASPEAQAKWNQSKIQKSNDFPFVKPEPKDNDQIPVAPAKKPAKNHMDFNKIMAAQRALLKNMQSNSNPARSNSNSIFGSRSRTPTPHQNEAESSRSFIPETPRPGKTFMRDDPSQVDAAMRDDEDHSWMHDDSASDDEYETLKTLHTSLSKKEKTGKITPNERMELFKLEKTLQMKERLRVAAVQRDAAAEDEEDDSLFVQESREDVVDRHRRNRPRRNSNDSEDDEMADGFGDGDGGEDDTMMTMLQQELNGDGLDGPGQPEQLTKNGKPRKKRAKNAREHYEHEKESRLQKERSKAQKKKGRGGNATSSRRKPSAAAKGKGKEKASSKKAKGKKGTVKNGESLLRTGNYNRYSGTDDVGNMILEDLMTNDPISDRLQNPIFNVEPEAPMPGQHRKESQFQMLFANIPTGDGSKANVKSVKSDKKALKEASRSFGYAQVKAQDGKWIIKGMKSTLYHHQLLGAQWMVQRELSSQPPHGGLLADSMG
jgi:hypothetical protein